MTKKTSWLVLFSVLGFFALMAIIQSFNSYRASSDRMEEYLSGLPKNPQVKEDVRLTPVEPLEPAELPKPINPKPIEPLKPSDSRDVFRADYMEGCMVDANMFDFCTCNYEYLCDKYGVGAMAQAGLNLDSRESKDMIYDGVIHCLEYLK